jgi:hypothetical protein
MDITLNLNSKEYKDLTKYCELNKLIPEEIVKKSYLEGFMIEKHGLLSGSGEVKEVIKEVVVEKKVEIPVEVIKEVVKVEYVEIPVEKIVEVIKEIQTPPTEVEVIKYVDREVIKEVPIITEKESNDGILKLKIDALQNTVQKIREENLNKDKKIMELEKTIEDIQKFQENKQAVYLNGSNLKNKL